jgi:hypothetical protein
LKNFRLIRWGAVLVPLLFVLLMNPWKLFPEPANTLRWVTQSEEDNFAYDVFRGLNQQGPFTRINSRSILGAGTTDLEQHYDYSDTEIASDVVYWYYIESISLTGERKRLTPIFASRPKSASPW